MITKEIIDKHLKEDNFYTLLGVEKSATKQEIEKAFRKLSVKWHPDKLKLANDSLLESAKQVFQKMNEAKDALTDERKREIYDKFGKDGLKENGPEMHPEHQEEMMQEFMKKMFGNKFSKKSNVPNITLTEEFTLEELYNGKEYTKSIERISLCKDCNGYGSEDGFEHKCKDCGGSGMQIKVIKQGNMIQQMQQVCTQCRGSGSDTKVAPCKKCNGKKAFKEITNINIKIPKGAFEGIGLEMENMGNEIPLQDRGNKTRSSIIIKIKEKQHNTYVRGFTIPKYKEQADPKDLKTTLTISLAESLTGFTKTLKALDDKPITIFHEKIVKQGDVLVLPNNGMPILENNSQKGNLYVSFEIEYPETISNNTKKILWQLLTNTPYKDTNYSVSNNYKLELPDKYKFDRNPRVPHGYGKHNHNNESDDDNENDDMFRGGMGGAPPDCKVQ